MLHVHLLILDAVLFFLRLHSSILTLLFFVAAAGIKAEKVRLALFALIQIIYILFIYLFIYLVYLLFFFLFIYVFIYYLFIYFSIYLFINFFKIQEANRILLGPDKAADKVTLHRTFHCITITYYCYFYYHY
jgi:hypothetical protein